MGLNDRIDFPPALPTRASTDEKMSFIYELVKKLWSSNIEQKKEIARLKSLVNSDVSTKRILEIIKNRT